MRLLSVENLKVHFPVRTGLLRRVTDAIRAVDGVSFGIEEGKTLGLVGESGSGKSTLSRALIKLGPVTSGIVSYGGRQIQNWTEAEFRPLRKQMQMVFQDPFSSLNPRMTIGKIIDEPMGIHFKELTKRERHERVASLMRKVGLDPASMSRFPHEFSGGQRQRIGIARALAVEPKFLICDEPVSALDVSVQAQILNLLKDLQQELGLTYLFIAHDLAVVRHMSDDIIVLYRGKIVEQGRADEVCERPRHEYTQKLLHSVATV
ncbi:MAG: ABC transporter ATP-binding protein [Verrucomicrobiaceae bacterium]|nr:ABC transporter ATP-binding protein [Verrucomicrobiaceae bacterium]